MIDTVKLCDTLGLDPKEFYIIFASENTPWLFSTVECGRQITPDSLENENMLLYEVEEMFQEHISRVRQTLGTIQRFRAMMYGPTSKECKNENSDSGTDNKNKPGTDTGSDRSTKKEQIAY